MLLFITRLVAVWIAGRQHREGDNNQIIIYSEKSFPWHKYK